MASHINHPRWLELITELNQQNMCKYTLIEHKDWEEWHEECMATIEGESSFGIGTRLMQAFKLPTLFTQKVYDPSGRKIRLSLDDISEERLLQYCTKAQTIFFYEDVVVEGRTLECICDLIANVSPYTKVYFNIYISNAIALSRLMKDYPLYTFKTKRIMKGEPIKESTLLCIWDLMHSKLNGHPYLSAQNDHLMKRVFKSSLNRVKNIVSDDS